MTQVDESVIQSFWQDHPVGENIVGNLRKDFGGDYASFFDAYDKWYYGCQHHVLKALDLFDWKGKEVLEIGLGQGADSEQLVRRGALWSGIDLTAESVRRVATRFKLRGLEFGELVQGSALSMPFEDRKFDMVFSHGVLLCIPDIQAAQHEIRRVLKDDGRLVVMLYARNSINYQISIKWIRRLGLAALYFLPVRLSGIYAAHKRNAKAAGLWNYLAMKNFIHRSTDGPDNPYAKVYDVKTLREDFPDFELIRTFKRYMHAPPLPLHGLPGESIFGWHLWAELRPRSR
ncbi:MAG TPA: class I SAM-dependent methyltransferase [Rhizomicrobium sp.]